MSNTIIHGLSKKKSTLLWNIVNQVWRKFINIWNWRERSFHKRNLKKCWNKHWLDWRQCMIATWFIWTSSLIICYWNKMMSKLLIWDCVESQESRNGQILIKVIPDTWLKKFWTIMKLLIWQRLIFTVWECLFSKEPFCRTYQTMVSNGCRLEMRGSTWGRFHKCKTTLNSSMISSHKWSNQTGNTDHHVSNFLTNILVMSRTKDYQDSWELVVRVQESKRDRCDFANNNRFQLSIIIDDID